MWVALSPWLRTPCDGDSAWLWATYLQALAAVYAVSFASLAAQVRALGGCRGIRPVCQLLTAAAMTPLPAAPPSAVRRCSLWPSVLWLFGLHGTKHREQCAAAQRVASSIDNARRPATQKPRPVATGTDAGGSALLLVCLGGLCAAIACVVLPATASADTGAAAAGLLARGCMAACWVLWLSLATVLPEFLAFPWDGLLCEAGALALLLPCNAAIVGADDATVSDGVAWAHRLLLFRVLVGMGKSKFPLSWRCEWARPSNLSYTKWFLAWQPLPSKLAWWMHHCVPLAGHVVALVAMFAVEMVLPFLLFLPASSTCGGVVDAVRAGAVAAEVALQLAIAITGNYGTFNVLTAALCLAAAPRPRVTLDASATLFDVVFVTARSMLPPVAASVDSAVVLFYAVGAVAFAPQNSYTTNRWLHRRRPRGGDSWLWAPVDALCAALRAIAPLRLLHGYGVFGPDAQARGRGARRTLVIQGEWSAGREAKWCTVAPHWYPTLESSPPALFAPHQPRVDHLMFYEGVGQLPGHFNALCPWVGSRRSDKFDVRALDASIDSHCPSLFIRMLSRLLQGPAAAPDVCALFRVAGLPTAATTPSLSTTTAWSPLPGEPPRRVRVLAVELRFSSVRQLLVDARRAGVRGALALLGVCGAEPPLRWFRRGPSVSMFLPPFDLKGAAQRGGGATAVCEWPLPQPAAFLRAHVAWRRRYGVGDAKIADGPRGARGAAAGADDTARRRNEHTLHTVSAPTADEVLRALRRPGRSDAAEAAPRGTMRFRGTASQGTNVVVEELE